MSKNNLPPTWVAFATALTLSGLSPAFAQLGQSELINPSAPSSNVGSLEPVNPGKGWVPAQRFQHAAPVMDQDSGTVQPPQVQQPAPDGPQLGSDGSMPWQDVRRHKPAQPMTQAAAPPDGSAFQAGTNGAPDAWTLPSAQQQMGMQWQQGGSNGGNQSPQRMPAANSRQQQANQLNGMVTQNANSQQQLNPDAGFPAPMNGGGMGQNGMAQMNAGGMADQMGSSGGLPQNSMPVNSGMGGMPDAGQMNAMGGVGGMPSGNPLDAIGQQIARAAAMGLIPNSGAANYNPNAGLPMQAAPPPQYYQQRPHPHHPYPGERTVHQLSNTAVNTVQNNMGNFLWLGLRGIRW